MWQKHNFLLSKSKAVDNPIFYIRATIVDIKFAKIKEKNNNKMGDWKGNIF